MSWRVTAVLAVLVTAAGLWVAYDTGPRDGAPDGPAASSGDGPPLLHFDPAAVTRILIAGEEGTVQFVRQGDTWGGTERPDLSEDFLHNLLVLRVIFSEPAAAGELADYGLAPPQHTVTLVRNDGDDIVLRVGARNPSGTGVYVQRGGPDAPVLLTGSLLSWEIEKVLRAAKTS